MAAIAPPQPYNTERQLQSLTRHCQNRQQNTNRRIEDLVSLASVVTAVFAGIIFGIAFTPLTGFLLGVVFYGVSSSLYTLLAEKLKSRKLERALLALGQQDFIEFANRRKIPLSMDSVLIAHQAYLKHLRQLINRAGG